MGAIFMYILVTVIAFVGGIYFVIQDRKEEREQEEEEDV
jgi:preprotein translocase subunit YajC